MITKRLSLPLFTLLYLGAVLFSKLPWDMWIMGGTLVLDFIFCTPLYSAHEHEDEGDSGDEAAKELKGRKADKRLVS